MKKLKSKIKRLSALILSLLTIMSVMPSVSVSAGATSDGLLYSINDGEVAITDYYGSASTLVIPANIKGYPVTSIADGAFSGCTSLESITIPDSVTSIGDGAFYGCINLQNIIMSHDMSKIGFRAFYDTAYYNNSANWEDGVLYIGKSLIEIKEGVRFCYIKEGTSYIAQKAFSAIPRYGILGGGTSYIGPTSLMSVYVPDSVKKIDIGSFFYCDNLDDVYINSLEAWCDIEFADSTANPLFWGQGNLYLNGKLLTNIEIPKEIDKINSYAFIGCKCMKSVEIPEGVTSIGRCAFGVCKSLQDITIPSSVTHISQAAFYDCINLKNVYITDMVAWENIDFEEETEDSIFNEKNLYLNGVLVEDSENTVPTEPSVPSGDEPEVPSNPGDTSTTAPIEPSTGGQDKPTDPTDLIVIGLLGDANGDGKVNVKDATEIQKAVAGLLTLDETEELSADVDGSGKVNVKDATAIQKWVAGIETGFLIGEPVKKQ